MKKVLAIRTPEGQYLEFDTLRSRTDSGEEIVIDLSEAIFAQVIAVPESVRVAPTPQRNGKGTIIIDGAGGIESQEQVKG